MMPGRLFYRVGTGERLNEHILGTHWPDHAVRVEMLEEARRIMRELLKGEIFSHDGKYFTVEDARLHIVPQQLRPIFVAASGPAMAQAAGWFGDGFISTRPDKSLIQAFERNGGTGKPRFAQMTVCCAASEDQARQTAHAWWPEAALTSPENTELIDPPQFEKAVKIVTVDQVATSILCGPDLKSHIDRLQKHLDAGIDDVYIHQVGPDQEGFSRFYQQHILPHFRRGGRPGARATSTTSGPERAA